MQSMWIKWMRCMVSFSVWAVFDLYVPLLCTVSTHEWPKFSLYLKWIKTLSDCWLNQYVRESNNSSEMGDLSITCCGVWDSLLFLSFHVFLLGRLQSLFSSFWQINHCWCQTMNISLVLMVFCVSCFQAFVCISVCYNGNTLLALAPLWLLLSRLSSRW